MKISSINMISCCACGSKNLKEVLKMPNLSHVGVYCTSKDEEKNFPRVDNNLNICGDCGHGQLTKALDPNFLYNKSFQHCTSCSKIAKQANDWLYEFSNEDKSLKTDVVAEIGINDSYCLKKYSEKAKRLIGIDPILKGKESIFLKDISDHLKEKFILIGDFIENVDFLDHCDEKPDLYISNFVFEHIKDPVDVLRRILKEAKDDALIIIGVPGSEFLYDNSRFDQLSHQHYQQFTTHSLRIMVERGGGEIIRMSSNYSNWGHIAVAFKKRKNNKNKKFDTSIIYNQSDVKSSFSIFNAHLDLLKKRLNTVKRKKIFGFGAAQNFPTFANFFKDDFPFDIILEDDSRRQGTFFPHYKYTIEKPKTDDFYKDCIGVVTGPDYARFIVSRMAELKFDNIITPFNSH